MTRPELADWLVTIAESAGHVFVKRLSANDTGLTGAHQVGFYLPRPLADAFAPGIGREHVGRRPLDFDLASHDEASRPTLIWYESKREYRVTGFGGRNSALQDPDSTGSILVTAWDATAGDVAAWLTTSIDEEEAVEAVFGPVDPGAGVVRLSDDGHPMLLVPVPAPCNPDIASLPAAWATRFPAGAELANEAVRRRPGGGQTPDRRLVDRYRCEFGLFRVVEQAHALPLVLGGFPSIDAFLAVAQPIANRRKARAGNSLEIHLAKVFDEEGVRYETHARTEGNRMPDFVFPSSADYHAGERTWMLGAKTSVKDRWRQVLDEAARIHEKHLFTLSEGVSPDQFAQMESSHLRLVVPESNLTKFPASVRSRLVTLADFVSLVR